MKADGIKNGIVNHCDLSAHDKAVPTEKKLKLTGGIRTRTGGEGKRNNTEKEKRMHLICAAFPFYNQTGPGERTHERTNARTKRNDFRLDSPTNVQCVEYDLLWQRKPCSGQQWGGSEDSMGEEP